MIELIDLRKQFGNTKITKGVNLTIPDHEMTVIIGRSGEGKSVLLKQITGLIRPTSGKILINEVDVLTLKTAAAEKIYDTFGYVFQFAALFDSLPVYENIGIKLLENGMPIKKVLEIVKETLALVHLSPNILFKYPSELSGGMRKRVGLARTMITHPKIILYDEPTTGLDPITSRAIHRLMYDMQKQFNITSVVISHDTDIFNYADHVALLHDGIIQYFGKAQEIWESNNPYIYQFIRGLSDGPIKSF